MPDRSDLSRRQFLVQSATLAGASLGSGLNASAIERSGTERAPGERPVLRVGLVGLGDRGRHLLGAVLACDALRVTALCDVDPQRLKRSLDSVRKRGPAVGYTNARDLFLTDAVDAVLIATPVFLHRDHSLAALDAGKHVYCEKPMALEPAECREVLAAARQAATGGIVYQTGLQRRYNPRYRRSLEFLHGGEAGDVRFVRAQWHSVTSARRDKPWLNRRATSGDIVLEQACHQFDVFNWVYRSPPLRATAVGGTHDFAGPPGRDLLDHYGAMLEYPCGGKVQLSHLTYSIPDRRFAGIYELAFCEKTGVDLAHALTWDGSGKTRELCSERGNETQLAVASFAEHASLGRRPVADAEVGYYASLAALLCRKAIDTGTSVAFEDIENA